MYYSMFVVSLCDNNSEVYSYWLHRVISVTRAYCDR